ncbi:hypothetical protein Peur_019095 [Populus x canadensis]
MNNLAQHVSHDYAGRNSSGHIGYSSDATDDSNANDDGNNEDNNEDDDDDDDDDASNSFWDREFDHCKLVLCIEDALALYYNNYIYKQPCMIPYNI